MATTICHVCVFFFKSGFLSKSSNFVLFEPYDFVQISRACGTNIFKGIGTTRAVYVLNQHWLHVVALRISKQLPFSWSLMIPAWHLTTTMHYILVRGSSYQIWQVAVNVQSIWPLVDRSWSLNDTSPKQCFKSWSGLLPTALGNHTHFYAVWPQVDVSWPLHDLWLR